MTTPNPRQNRERPDPSARLAEMRALREELSTDLFDVEQVRDSFIESQGLETDGFRAEVVRGMSDSLSEDPTARPGEVISNIHDRLGEGEDNQEGLLDMAFENEPGERNFWDWDSPVDMAKHVLVGWAASLDPDGFVGRLFNRLFSDWTGVTEQREAFMSQLRNPGAVLENLHNKLERATEAGLPLSNENLNLGFITGLMGFVRGNEELLSEYEALDASDPEALSEWWENTLKAYCEQSNTDLDVEGDFAQSVIAVLTGQAAWAEVLIDADINELGREVDENGEVVEESGEYGNMVPLRDSQVGKATRSVMMSFQRTYRDNQAGFVAIAGNLGLAGLVPLLGAYNRGTTALTREHYETVSSALSGSESETPFSNVFDVAALLSEENEAGETVVPENIDDFKQYVVDRARENPSYSRLQNLTDEELDEVARAFLDPDYQIVDRAREAAGGLFSALARSAFERMAQTDEEFLISENRQGLENLMSSVGSLDIDATEAIADEIDRLKGLETVTWQELQSLNGMLQQYDFELELVNGFIWLKVKNESGAWEYHEKVMVDGSHENAQQLIREISQGEYGYVGEGALETLRLWLGDLEEFKEAVANDEYTLVFRQGFGIMVMDPAEVVVKRIIPYQYASVFAELFEGETGTFWEDMGVTVGSSMVPFMVLRGARSIGRRDRWHRFLFETFIQPISDVTWRSARTTIEVATRDGQSRIRSRLALWRDINKHRLERIRNIGGNWNHLKRLHRLRLIQFELRHLEILETRAPGSRSVLAGPRSNVANYMAQGHYDRIQRLALQAEVSLEHNGRPIRFERGANSIGQIRSAVDVEVDRVLHTDMNVTRRAAGAPRNTPETTRQNTDRWRQWGERFRGGRVSRRGVIGGVTAVTGALALSNMAPDGPGTEAEESTLTPEEAEALEVNLISLNEPLGDLLGAIESAETITNADAVEALEEVTSNSTREGVIERMREMVESNRDQYHSLVAAQEGQILQLGPFARLRVENEELHLDFASEGDMSDSFYEEFDAAQDPADDNWDTAWDIGGEFMPIERTGRSYERMTESWQRGHYGWAALNGAFFGLDALSDGLLAVGAGASATGIGAIGGVPLMAAGGVIRVATGVTRVLGRGARYLWNLNSRGSRVVNATAFRRNAGARRAMDNVPNAQLGATAAEQGSFALFSAELSQIHTF